MIIANFPLQKKPLAFIYVKIHYITVLYYIDKHFIFFKALLYFILIAIGTTIFVYLSNYLYNKHKDSRQTVEINNEEPKSDTRKPASKPRLRSLDTFRG